MGFFQSVTLLFLTVWNVTMLTPPAARLVQSVTMASMLPKIRRLALVSKFHLYLMYIKMYLYSLVLIHNYTINVDTFTLNIALHIQIYLLVSVLFMNHINLPKDILY